MQLQISKIHNGYLVASQKDPDQKELSRMSPEQRQQYLSQPDVHWCADYEDVCNYIKRFFPVE